MLEKDDHDDHPQQIRSDHQTNIFTYSKNRRSLKKKRKEYRFITKLYVYFADCIAIMQCTHLLFLLLMFNCSFLCSSSQSNDINIIGFIGWLHSSTYVIGRQKKSLAAFFIYIHKKKVLMIKWRGHTFCLALTSG